MLTRKIKLLITLSVVTGVLAVCFGTLSRDETMSARGDRTRIERDRAAEADARNTAANANSRVSPSRRTVSGELADQLSDVSLASRGALQQSAAISKLRGCPLSLESMGSHHHP